MQLVTQHFSAVFRLPGVSALLSSYLIAPPQLSMIFNISDASAAHLSSSPSPLHSDDRCSAARGWQRQKTAALMLLKLHGGSHPPSRSLTAHPRATETWGFLHITCLRLLGAFSSQVFIRDTSTAVPRLIYLAPQQCQLTCLQDHH